MGISIRLAAGYNSNRIFFWRRQSVRSVADRSKNPCAAHRLDKTMTTARIFNPSRSATQSGKGRSKEWVFEYAPSAPRQVEPLMGWTSSSDTLSQVRLTFETKEDAIAYATRKGIPYTVQEERARKMQKKSYADNFKYGRRVAWTH
jgi:hypothetical protein